MINNMSLAELISPWLVSEQKILEQIIVSNLQLDSRHIKQGDTFVAIIGQASDGRSFIDKAIEQGTNAIIAQADHSYPHGYIDYRSSPFYPYHPVLIVYIKDLHRHLSALAYRLYPISSQLIGVTGTNGKTTITQLIAQWCQLVGHKAAVMGTTGNGFLNALQPAVNTTANAIDMVKTLNTLSEQNAQYTALEVSSHGLDQGRVSALPFSIGIFSNLSRDHLDYHKTMEAYANAKQLLFTQCATAPHFKAIINIDDIVGLQWLNEFISSEDSIVTNDRIVAVSLVKPNHVISSKALWATQIEYAESGIVMQFDGSWGAGELSVPLIGEFNASNVLLAFACLLSLGFELPALIKSAKELRSVIGRMELFQAISEEEMVNEGMKPSKPIRSNKRAKIVVDYAHTPDALQKALTALRVHCHGTLWVVFGCGGDRDRGKRPLMAAIAEQFADRVILTDDNPRSEDPKQIVNDMLEGVQDRRAVMIEHARFKATQFALYHANSNDIILLAGKGHEDYQILNNETIYYSDRDVARQLLAQ